MDSIREQLLAGVFSGSVNALIMSPLDVCKSRLQVQSTMALPRTMIYSGILHCVRNIVETEGARGLWRGYSASAIAVPLFWSSYFVIYEGSKRQFSRVLTDNGQLEGALRVFSHSASAIVAALCCDTLTNPLWVARTRLQTMHLHQLANDAAGTVPYHGVFDALRTIVRSEGWQALYKGLIASWLGASHVAVQFPLYEYLRSEVVLWDWGVALHVDRPEPPSALPVLSSADLDVDLFSAPADDESFSSVGLEIKHPSAAGLVVASTVAKLVASFSTYPHETIRARLQDQRGSGGLNYKGTLDCAVRVARAEGLRGLYAGFSVNLVRALPSCVVTFFAYEWALRQLRRYRR